MAIVFSLQKIWMLTFWAITTKLTNKNTSNSLVGLRKIWVYIFAPPLQGKIKAKKGNMSIRKSF